MYCGFRFIFKILNWQVLLRKMAGFFEVDFSSQFKYLKKVKLVGTYREFYNFFKNGYFVLNFEFFLSILAFEEIKLNKLKLYFKNM